MAAPRLTLDTNVWLDLLVFADPRCAALRALLKDGRATALLDAACHAEWQRVLGYPSLRLGAARQQALVETQHRLCLWTDATAPLPLLPRCRDPDDQKFLELAARGGAQLLLSRDLALLELDRRLRQAGLFGVQSPQDFARAAADPCAGIMNRQVE